MEAVVQRRTSTNALNSPLECALRLLILLAELRETVCDTQQLVSLDFALVHSGDLAGPPSLHAPHPNRPAELLIRRQLLQRGADLLAAKGLLRRVYDSRGVGFAATDAGVAAASYLNTDYARRARLVASWIRATLGELDAKELAAVVSARAGDWGAEFTEEPVSEEDFDV